MKISMKPLDYIASFKGWRALNGRGVMGKRSFALFVLLPMAMVTLYYLLIATDRYVSESKMTIKQAKLETDTTLSPLSLLLGGNPLAREDAFYLKEYIYSWDMLNFLDKSLNLRKEYQNTRADFFTRLSQRASREDFIDYYRDHVEVVFDEITSILTIRTEGFSPEIAQKINTLILQQCERFVNEISQKIAADQMVYVDSEVARAGAELQKAKNSMVGFQNKHNVLDPSEQARATGGIITALEGTLATQEAELSNLLTYMQDSAPQVVTAKSKIAALKQQIKKEKTLLSGEGSGHLNKLAAQFADVKQVVDFQFDVYKATVAALEKSRFDASKKIKSVVTIASPNLPEEAEYPRKIYVLISVFVMLMLFYGIVSLILAIIREHHDETF